MMLQSKNKKIKALFMIAKIRNCTPIRANTTRQTTWTVKALTTAIWGVLKAKASYLKDQFGYMAHFYVVSQYILPVLAWGFLGPDNELRGLCEYFKGQMLGYIRDVFSFRTADYSSVKTLSHSIITLARQRSEVLTKRLELALPEDQLPSELFNVY